MACSHCWHVTASISYGFNGGYDRVICCHCGQEGGRQYGPEPVPGHGIYFNATETRQMEVVLDEAK